MTPIVVQGYIHSTQKESVCTRPAKSGRLLGIFTGRILGEVSVGGACNLLFFRAPPPAEFSLLASSAAAVGLVCNLALLRGAPSTMSWVNADFNDTRSSSVIRFACRVFAGKESGMCVVMEVFM